MQNHENQSQLSRAINYPPPPPAKSGGQNFWSKFVVQQFLVKHLLLSHLKSVKLKWKRLGQQKAPTLAQGGY